MGVLSVSETDILDGRGEGKWIEERKTGGREMERRIAREGSRRVSRTVR